MAITCPSCGYENRDGMAFCNLCKLSFGPLVPTFVPPRSSPPPPPPALPKDPRERALQLLREVSKLILKPLPPAPRERPYRVSVPVDDLKNPSTCAGCGERTEGREILLPPFNLREIRERKRRWPAIEMAFCRECAALRDARRKYLILRGVVSGILFFATMKIWDGFVVLCFVDLLRVGLLASRRGWGFGANLAALASDGLTVELDVDHKGHADALITLNEAKLKTIRAARAAENRENEAWSEVVSSAGIRPALPLLAAPSAANAPPSPSPSSAAPLPPLASPAIPVAAAGAPSGGPEMQLVLQIPDGFVAAAAPAFGGNTAVGAAPATAPAEGELFPAHPPPPPLLGPSEPPAGAPGAAELPSMRPGSAEAAALAPLFESIAPPAGSSGLAAGGAQIGGGPGSAGGFGAGPPALGGGASPPGVAGGVGGFGGGPPAFGGASPVLASAGRRTPLPGSAAVPPPDLAPTIDDMAPLGLGAPSAHPAFPGLPHDSSFLPAPAALGGGYPSSMSQGGMQGGHAGEYGPGAAVPASFAPSAGGEFLHGFPGSPSVDFPSGFRPASTDLAPDGPGVSALAQEYGGEFPAGHSEAHAVDFPRGFPGSPSVDFPRGFPGSPSMDFPPTDGAELLPPLPSDAPTVDGPTLYDALPPGYVGTSDLPPTDLPFPLSDFAPIGEYPPPPPGPQSAPPHLPAVPGPPAPSSRSRDLPSGTPRSGDLPAGAPPGAGTSRSRDLPGGATPTSRSRDLPGGARSRDLPGVATPSASSTSRSRDLPGGAPAPASTTSRSRDLPGGGPPPTSRSRDLPGGGPPSTSRSRDLPGGGPPPTSRSRDLPGGGPAPASTTSRSRDLPGGAPPPAAITSRSRDLPGGGPPPTSRSRDLPGGGPAPASTTSRSRDLPGGAPPPAAITSRSRDLPGGAPAPVSRSRDLPGGAPAPVSRSRDLPRAPAATPPPLATAPGAPGEAPPPGSPADGPAIAVFAGPGGGLRIPAGSAVRMRRLGELSTPSTAEVELDPPLRAALAEPLQRAELLMAERSFPEALAVLESALELLPPPLEQWPVAPRIYAALGEARYQLRHYEETVRCMNLALACPDGAGDPLFLLRCGQAQLELGHTEPARESLTSAYLGGGEELFRGEDPKYLALAQTWGGRPGQ